MNTMILLSGGWKSAYALIRWLRTNPGNVIVLRCRLGDVFGAHRVRAAAAVRAYVEDRYPGRVSWYESNLVHTFPDAPDPRSALSFLVGVALASSACKDVSQVIVTRKMGLPKESIVKPSLVDALTEVPDDLFRQLATCDQSPLPCGNCPACIEIETARKQIRG